MKRDADWFGETEPVLVYIAGRLGEAQKLETVLTAAGLDYGVETDEYEGGFIFRRTRTGAFFYVTSDALPATLETMRAHGYKPISEPG